MNEFLYKELIKSLKEYFKTNTPSTDNEIVLNTRLYTFYIDYEITKTPYFTCIDSGQEYPTDSSYQPEYELEGQFDFDITEIYAYDKDNNEINVLESLSKEQYDEIKSLFNFNPEDYAEGCLFEQKTIKINEQDIMNMVKRVINEVASKRTAINKIYKLTHDITGRMYKDENWHGVTLVVDAIESLGYDCEVTVKDGGYRSNPNDPFGMPWKEYLLRIETPEGFEIKGTLNCHSAGTTEDPFEKYDMSLVLY